MRPPHPFDLSAVALVPPLPQSFFMKDTAAVARDLLGKGLYVQKDGKEMLVEIVETEAYLGSEDAASHAFRGITKRNEAMFEQGGTCYVYLSYGINYCMNVATQKKGLGEAVLLRAAAPLLGENSMRMNRGFTETSSIKNLTNGPGKLTQALGVNLNYNGFTFDRADFRLVDLKRKISPKLIGISSRIGISKAQDMELRFFVKSSPWVSGIRKRHVY
jgi:DNA-3-methyladenine glycosylase